MSTYTITTTDDQETALAYAFAHLVAAPVLPGFPEPPPAPTTQEEYLQQQVDFLVLAPMGQRYGRDVSTAVQQSLQSVPPENQQAALDAIKQTITDSGGTVVEPGESAPPTDPAKRTIPWDVNR